MSGKREMLKCKMSGKREMLKCKRSGKREMLKRIFIREHVL